MFRQWHTDDDVYLQRVGVCVPEHVAGGCGAIVGQFGGGRQGRVCHLLDVGVRRGRLGRFLLAERLFEGASQLRVENGDRETETMSSRGIHSQIRRTERERRESGGKQLWESASESRGEREIWVDCLMTWATALNTNTLHTQTVFNAFVFSFSDFFRKR